MEDTCCHNIEKYSEHGSNRLLLKSMKILLIKRGGIPSKVIVSIGVHGDSSSSRVQLQTDMAFA